MTALRPGRTAPASSGAAQMRLEVVQRVADEAKRCPGCGRVKSLGEYLRYVAYLDGRPTY